MLLDGSKPQPLSKIRSASTQCGDVQAKGRDAQVMATDQGAKSMSLAKLVFGATNFAT